MIYRPNFCCSCGEKIERAKWPLMASRRFCDLCQTDHQAVDWLPRIVVILGLVFGLAGLVALYKPTQRGEGVTIRPSAATVSRSDLQLDESRFNATPTPIPQSQTGPEPTDTERSPVAPPAMFKGAAKANETGAVYYCGAATKKGTPCTRRVKRRGERCWQHQGMPSMAESAQK